MATTMAIEDRWDELASAAGSSPGLTRLRVAPSSPHDLFIGIVQPGDRRSFWCEVPTASVPDDYRLPPLRSICTTIQPVVEVPTTTRVHLELEKAELGSVFAAMANDLISTIAAAPDDESGLAALSQRAERWRRLLETEGAAGLSTTERRGLAGELIVLGQLLDAAAGPVHAIDAWTGPANAHQDFQAAQAAIEVKTTITKQPQSLVIASERELDPTGVSHLYLMHLSLDERRDGVGHSLNDLVGQVRAKVGADAVASALLDQALLQAGYFDEHAALYDAPRYTVREQDAYEVLDGFPCITETDVPRGVGDVAYRIQLSALADFAVPLSDAIDAAATP